jgi:hypothetical protein
MPGIPTHFLLWQKPPGRQMGEIHPKMAKFTPKGVIRSLGALIHPEMVQNVEISKLSKLSFDSSF